MNVLIRILGLIILLLAFIVAILFFVYVISIELYEIFEVDVLFKAKRTLGRWCYGEKRSSKTLGKLFQRRANRSRRNRKTLHSIKARLREREFINKTVSQHKKKVVKEA